MSQREPPAPFDGDLVDDVAAEFGVDSTRLLELLDAHQTQMEQLPGVENLVYEWRKQFDAIVLERTDAWYFVDAPEWTWEEFGAHLEASETELAALTALHQRTVAEHPESPDTGLDAATPVVVLRK